MIKVGIIGHRFFEQPGAEKFIFQQCCDILQRVKNHDENVIAVSPIAEGADSIFADAAISLSIPLEVVIPFEEYETDFVKEESKKCYHRLYNAANSITMLPHTRRSDEAYFDVMLWVVERSDLLIIVWDGKEGRGKGGTADGVKHAMAENIGWIHIDVSNNNVQFFPGKETDSALFKQVMSNKPG